MEIKRDLYLEQLKIRKDNGMIKIITGIRNILGGYYVKEYTYYRKHNYIKINSLNIMPLLEMEVEHIGFI